MKQKRNLILSVLLCSALFMSNSFAQEPLKESSRKERKRVEKENEKNENKQSSKKAENTDDANDSFKWMFSLQYVYDSVQIKYQIFKPAFNKSTTRGENEKLLKGFLKVLESAASQITDAENSNANFTAEEKALIADQKGYYSRMIKVAKDLLIDNAK